MLNLLIRKSKQIYYQNKLKQSKSDSKQIWNIIIEIISKPSKHRNKINTIINKDGIIIESKTDICNELIDFFVNVEKSLYIEFINSNIINFNDISRSNNSIFFFI